MLFRDLRIDQACYHAFPDIDHGAMAARDPTSLVCSITFVDIVDFARQSVEAQLQAKTALNGLVGQALDGVPAAERIVLDTAEGVAISFIGGAEDCLYAALALRERALDPAAQLALRVGINHGPVRLVKDLGGRPNLIGDGMSVGQRIVGFAAAGQVLASAAFYDALAALDPRYARLWDPAGTRTDAQVREHRVYALNDTPAPLRAARRATDSPAAARAVSAPASVFDALAQPLLARPRTASALAAMLIVVAALGLRQVVERAALEPAPALPEPGVSASAIPPARAPATPTPAPAATPANAPLARNEPASASVPAPVPDPPAPSAHLRLTIVPWGEVYVNGSKVGVAPPLRDLPLAPGTHRVEVRNPGFASHLQEVELRAGEEIRIRHRFN